MEKPDPPTEIPAYVADGIDRQDSETLTAIIDYCQQLIEYQEQDVPADELADDEEELVDVEESESGTVVIKRVPCGKDNCSTCPHGPYRYIVHREGEKLHWEYKGAVDSA